jgi:hypothetical protein
MKLEVICTLYTLDKPSGKYLYPNPHSRSTKNVHIIGALTTRDDFLYQQNTICKALNREILTWKLCGKIFMMFSWFFALNFSHYTR